MLAGGGLLAGAGRRRAAARRGAVSVRARRDELREPAGNARVLAEKLRSHVDRKFKQPDAAGGGQPMAGGRGRLLRQGRRVPHGVPLPDHAAPVHGAADGGPLPHPRHPGADAGDPADVPVGAVPAEPRRADAGDGHRGRARLHGRRLRAATRRRGSISASAAGWHRCSTTTASASS